MVTMDNIAQETGVSRTAVSLVLNGQYGDKIRIPEATRQRILDTAVAMGYRTNQLAKAMARGERMRIFGYLVASPRYEPYWNTIISALEEAEKCGFSMKVFSSREGVLLQQVRQCIEMRLGGLIIRVDGNKTEALEEARRAQVPVVIVDEGVAPSFGTMVAADDRPGCEMAIDHLLKMGHRRIAFISSGFPDLTRGPHDIGSTREEVFRRQMVVRGVDVPEGYIAHETTMVYSSQEVKVVDDGSMERAVHSLLAHPLGAPTAVLCWRDETAIFAIAECRRQGLRVPDDISIVGFSDISAASLIDPPLSTVQSPWKGMGEMAVRQLVANFNTQNAAPTTSQTVASSFVVRRSTGPAPRVVAGSKA